VSLIQPYAPHAAEELWERLGGSRPWGEPRAGAGETQLVDDEGGRVLQGDGKGGGREPGPAGGFGEEVGAGAEGPREGRGESEEAGAFVVPDKLVNLVV